MDKISSLPDNVIEAIVECLPLRDAVRTSVLSHCWREKWCSVPQLVFDSKHFPRSVDETQEEYGIKLARVIDRVLLLHAAPIRKFSLSINQEIHSDIDRWIHFLSRHGVQEFTLKILCVCPYYRLPSYFFSFKEICSFHLFRCKLHLPSPFTGFSRLTVLQLRSVTFTEDGLGILLSLCPLLRNLSLRHISGCTSLKINSHKLEELSIDTEYIPLHLEYTPLLAIASIQFWGLHYHPNSDDDERNIDIVDVLGHLPSIERLTLDFHLQVFTNGVIPFKLPVLFPLRHLFVNINFGHMKDLLAAFCIFRSSLALEKLCINVTYDKVGGGVPDDFWEAPEGGGAAAWDCSSSHLRVMEVCGIRGRSTELKFLEFVMAKAPLLERLQIQFRRRNVDEAKILRELVRFRRSSAKAEIIVLDEDASPKLGSLWGR